MTRRSLAGRAPERSAGTESPLYVQVRMDLRSRIGGFWRRTVRSSVQGVTLRCCRHGAARLLRRRHAVRPSPRRHGDEMRVLIYSPVRLFGEGIGAFLRSIERIEAVVVEHKVMALETRAKDFHPDVALFDVTTQDVLPAAQSSEPCAPTSRRLRWPFRKWPRRSSPARRRDSPPTSPERLRGRDDRDRRPCRTR